MFARDPKTNQFLLAKDFTDSETPEPLSSQPVEGSKNEYPPNPAEAQPDGDSAFHHLMHSPTRLTLPGTEKARTKLIESNPKLKAALVGKELVPVKGEDIGVEAVDKYVLRISLVQPAPFFLGLLAHQFFRLVPRKTVEQYGRALDRSWAHCDVRTVQIEVVGALQQACRRAGSNVLGCGNSKVG